MKKVIWTRTSKKSLRETYDFISGVWSDEIGEEFLNQLDYRISQIQRNPELAPTFIDSEFR